jgi:hypothetical protein
LDGVPTGMKVICAWCQHEGRSGLLRVREPLDDPSETHGICDRHQQAVFEAFPSASFPSTRWLFIVPASDVPRYEHLVKLLRDVPGTTVILDRRRADRRRQPEAPSENRRRFDRRVRRPEMTSFGYGLIRFKASQSPATPQRSVSARQVGDRAVFDSEQHVADDIADGRSDAGPA